MEAQEIAAAFNLRPRRTVKNKYYYIISCGVEEYKLYPTALTSDEIIQLYELKNHIINEGILTDTLILSQTGLPYFEIDAGKYIALKTIKGSPLNFRSKNQVTAAVREISAVHKAVSVLKPKAADLLQEYKNNIKILDSIKTTINRKNKFVDADMLFMKNYGYMSHICRQTLDILTECNINNSSAYVHGSPKEENIIYNGKIALVNWNFKVNTPLSDLAYFVQRYVKKYAFDAFKNNEPFVDFYTIAAAYEENFTIDFQLLRALTLCPHKYVKVTAEYYKHPKPFTPVYIKNKINQHAEIQRFLAEYTK